ncbi:hypothetical protein D3C87_1783640 [compost metagenome]
MLNPSPEAAVAGERIGFELDDHLCARSHEAHITVQDQGFDDQVLAVRYDGDQGLPGLRNLAQGGHRDLVHHA